jgi:hypothetical protein
MRDALFDRDSSTEEVTTPGFAASSGKHPLPSGRDGADGEHIGEAQAEPIGDRHGEVLGEHIGEGQLGPQGEHVGE